jgi:hypothetical protein
VEGTAPPQFRIVTCLVTAPVTTEPCESMVFPRSLVPAALLITAAVSMVALAPSRATPSGAIDSDDATWTISGRGRGDPESKDSQAVVVVVRWITVVTYVFRCANARCLWCIVLSSVYRYV